MEMFTSTIDGKRFQLLPVEKKARKRQTLHQAPVALPEYPYSIILSRTFLMALTTSTLTPSGTVSFTRPSTSATRALKFPILASCARNRSWQSFFVSSYHPDSRSKSSSSVSSLPRPYVSYPSLFLRILG